MRVIGQGTKSDLQIDEDVDANTTASLTSIAMGDATKVGIFVSGKTGSHTRHVITLQLSPDNGTTWVSTVHTITGEGFQDDLTVIGTNIRARVSTPEGGTSTIDVALVIK